MSYCNFYGIDRSLSPAISIRSLGLCINTTQLSVQSVQQKPNAFHFECGTILTKTNFGVSIYVLTLLESRVSEWAKRNQIVIITNKQF